MNISHLPDGWAEASIEEFCEVIQGQSPPGDTYNEVGKGVAFFQGKAEFGDLYPRPSKWCTAPTKFTQRDDILISIRAPVGPTNLAPGSCCIGRGLAAIRPRDGISPRYVLYALRASADQLANQGTGSTFQAISGSVLRSHRLPLPPLPEQRRIVEVIESNFARLDAAVAALERAKANLIGYRESVLTAACKGHLIAARPSLRTLGEIADIQGGITLGKKRDKKERLRAVPYLRVANVQRGRLDLSEMKSIMATEEEITRLRLVGGDVLFNEGGDRDKLGRGWIWEDQVPECIHQNHVFRARVHDGIAVPKFISYYGNSVAQKYFWDEGKHTTNMASLNRTSLASLPIRLPPVSAQIKIVSEVERLLSVSDAAFVETEGNLKRTAQFRQSLLRAAFEGNLVPQDPSDEPAVVLLERIKREHPPAMSSRSRGRRGQHRPNTGAES